MTVARWHQNPNPALRNSGDCIDAHQRRVAMLCLEIAAWIKLPLHNSDLIQAALVHDEAERILGDMPWPAKARFPALAAAYAEAEREILSDMGKLYDLPPQEAAILKLADRADAWRWATLHRAADTEEWIEAKRDLHRTAYAMGLDCGAWWEHFRREVETP